MDYNQVIQIKYPGIRSFTNYQLAEVVTPGDPSKTFIKILVWNWSEPMPTIEELGDYANTEEYQQRVNAIERLRYRQDRATAYIAELSPEGTFETSVGDLLDAIIMSIYGDRSKLDLLKSAIDDIKRRHPKPE